jgi:YD repeat-containing protein
MASGSHGNYGYDSVNRLLWERHGAATAADDVTYHFDAPYQLVGGVGQAPGADPRYPEPQHFVLGRLAWVADESGQRFSSFDERGRQTTDVRVVVDRQNGNAILGTWVRRRAYDDLDREIAHVFPDSTQVAYQYSSRGLLERIPGYVSQIDYNAAGQPVSRVLADAKATTATWRYDAENRLRSHATLQSDGTPLLDRKVDLDRAGNVIGLTQDAREGLRPGDAPPAGWLASYDLVVGRQGYDALYRLLGVGYAYHATPLPPVTPYQVREIRT